MKILYFFEGMLHGVGVQYIINLINRKLWGQSWTRVSLLTFKMHGGYLNAWKHLLWVDAHNSDSPQHPGHLIRPLNTVPFQGAKIRGFFHTDRFLKRWERKFSPVSPEWFKNQAAGFSGWKHSPSPSWIISLCRAYCEKE